MTIRRLDAFFKTQLIFDQRPFFNSITNLALAPLQRLIGQHQFQSLKGKIHYIPQITTAAPASYIATFFKVVVFVSDFFIAIILTPIGIATRFMSFQSPKVYYTYLLTPLSVPANQEHTLTFLSQFSSLERTRILKKLPPLIQAAFLNLDENEEFSKKYLSQLTKPQYSRLMPRLSAKLLTLKTADDLDALLDETLEDYQKISCGSSDQSVVDPCLDFADINENFDIEKSLVDVALMGLDTFFSLMKLPASVMAEKGQQVNEAIKMLNLFFKALLQHSDNPGLWLEQESKKTFYRNCHPFAASYCLATSLNQATCLHKHLNPALIKEWEINNQRCVALLRNNDLDQYNETEFPFSMESQSLMEDGKKTEALLTPYSSLIVGQLDSLNDERDSYNENRYIAENLLTQGCLNHNNLVDET